MIHTADSLTILVDGREFGIEPLVAEEGIIESLAYALKCRVLRFPESFDASLYVLGQSSTVTRSFFGLLRFLPFRFRRCSYFRS